MNPNPSPNLPVPWPDLLAAYVDGELGPALHAMVERRLARSPTATDAMRDQAQLSPANWPLWQRAEPPLPSESQWHRVCQAIRAGIDSPPTPARSRETGGGLRAATCFAAGVAAVLAAVVIADVAQIPGHSSDSPIARETPNERPSEFAVLPMATDADVDVEGRVIGAIDGWLPVGDALESLTLAREDDVDLEEGKPHSAWPGGTPRMITAPGDAPMIFAARSR